MDYYTWLYGKSIKKQEPKDVLVNDEDCIERQSVDNFYSWIFDGHDKPVNETLAEHREHCEAEQGNCPFEKKINKQNESEEVVSVNPSDGNPKFKRLNQIIDRINKWGASKSEEDAVEKLNGYLRDNSFSLKAVEAHKLFAFDRTPYYVVKAELQPNPDIKQRKWTWRGSPEEVYMEDVSRAFGDAGYKCKTHGLSLLVSMPSDKLLKHNVDLNVPKTADEKRTEGLAKKEWSLSEKSKKDIATLQQFARESELSKVHLNAKINDFGGGKIPVWKALIRAHEEGWAIGEMQMSEVLFNENNPSEYLLVPKETTTYARALGMNSHGKIPRYILKATKGEQA